MEARAKSSVRSRGDRFGGICYVPHRDDFFALDQNAFRLLRSHSDKWTLVPRAQEKAVAALARLGLCETRQPATRERAFSGPSFVGDFEDIVTVTDPLVLNCFATAFCPLACRYCHADDLMSDFRKTETASDIPNVVATASLIPALVAVITGGDPLTRPERAIALIEQLSPQKALVIDTSGVGDFDVLSSTVKQHGVHVRISLDAISPLNDDLRPLNAKIAGRRAGSLSSAASTIESCLLEDIPVTVQTVVTARNASWDELRDLRDWLVNRGVQHWVLHMCVPAGSARKYNERAEKKARPQLITPDATAYDTVKRLVADTQAKDLKLDIRCTDTANTPNSVLLVASNGDLYTEGLARKGKNRLFQASQARPDLIKNLWFYVDHFGHARRYLNWNAMVFGDQSLSELCYDVPALEEPSQKTIGIVETEGKFRVIDVSRLRALLGTRATEIAEESLQRDEYYDTPQSSLRSGDFVVRIRIVDGRCEVCLKGPRFWILKEYSRVELEFDTRRKRK
jgi:MoaA/NifB/PqqE/SkfB family radical SAM enzyme